MGVERTASVVWQGSLTEGSGTATAVSSGVFKELPVSWPARTETPGGKTSPEELIAAAHASCYAMALSHALGQAGHTPARLDITATSSGHKGKAGWQIDSMDIDVVADVPGIDSTRFDEALAVADQGCPVSNALRGGIEIRVKGSLRV